MLSNGDVFAGYVIERQLGRGGMGSVYLAKHPRLPRMTALKLLNREMVFDKEVRARFEREADLVAQLDHHNIVTVYDRGLEDGQLWISMQYIDGVDAASVNALTLPPERAVQIIAEMGDALDYAHRNEVLHRDVKPANILLARSTGGKGERVYLTDFGIARLRDDHGQNLTQTGTFTATLAYASPEQLTGSALDGRSDQYSLACTLFWLLTGSGPFSATNPAAVIQGHLQNPPPPLSSARPGLPPALDMVLNKAMAKRAEERFATCSDFAAAARRALSAPSAPAMPLVGNRTAPPMPVQPHTGGAGPMVNPMTGGPSPTTSGPNHFQTMGHTPQPQPVANTYTGAPQPTNQYTAPAYNFAGTGGGVPPGPPTMGGPIGGQRPGGPPPKKSNAGVIIGAIVGALVLVIGAVVVGVALGGGSDEENRGLTTASGVSTTAKSNPTGKTTPSAKPTTTSAGSPGDASAIAAKFPRMVPASESGDIGYNGADCWVADPSSPPDKSEGEPDFGDYSVQWRCFGGGENKDPFYRFYVYSSPAKAQAVVNALSPDTKSSDANGGKTYTNYQFTDQDRPRMVTAFTGDNERAVFLMYTDGVVGTIDEVLTWWRSAPLN
ncbi:serine/threonine-protein kinase [Nocardia sp. NPDC003693]